MRQHKYKRNDTHGMKWRDREREQVWASKRTSVSNNRMNEDRELKHNVHGFELISSVLDCVWAE